MTGEDFLQWCRNNRSRLLFGNEFTAIDFHQWCERNMREVNWRGELDRLAAAGLIEYVGYCHWRIVALK